MHLQIPHLVYLLSKKLKRNQTFRGIKDTLNTYCKTKQTPLFATQTCFHHQESKHLRQKYDIVKTKQNKNKSIGTI